MSQNQDVTPEELERIRVISDFDIIMLISEINDHGWQRARLLLPMMPHPNREEPPAR